MIYCPSRASNRFGKHTNAELTNRTQRDHLECVDFWGTVGDDATVRETSENSIKHWRGNLSMKVLGDV